MRDLLACVLVISAACGDDAKDEKPSAAPSGGSTMQPGTGKAGGESAAAVKTCVAESASGFERVEVPLDVGFASATGTRVGDLNADGKADILLSNSFSGAAVLLGQERGFAAPIPASKGVSAGHFADVNGDKHVDVVSLGKQISIALGDGKGNLTLVAEQAFPYTFALVKPLDVDADGRTDLIAYASDTDECAKKRETVEAMPKRSCGSDQMCEAGEGCFEGKCVFEQCHHVLTYAVDVEGKLTETGKSAAMNLDSYSGDREIVGFDDVNKDGAPDVVMAGLLTGVYLNDGKLSFTSSGVSEVLDQAGQVRDIDGDGTLDLWGNDVISWGKSWAKGEMQERTKIASVENGQDLLIDLDGDKDLDALGVTNLGNGKFAFELNVLQDRKLAEIKYICSESRFAFVNAGDFNGDGKNDIAYATDLRKSVVLLLQK